MWNGVYAQTILQPGDVAVIGYNFKDPDQFSFIFLKDVAAGTVIYITDCGYDAPTAAFRVGEGYLTYTVPAGGIKTGKIITYPDDAGFIKQGVSGFFGLSVDGDQLIFFQGSFTAPVFIYALSVDTGGWQTSASDNNTSALPPGLTNGTTALAQTRVVNSRLNCTGIAIDKSLFLTQITDISKWERSNTTRVALPDLTCDYTVLSFKEEENVNKPLDTKIGIVNPGYWQIDVFGPEGSYYFSVNDLEQAMNRIIREKMYIFKVYYPDRLEVIKVISE
jgi:hypothetical protein